MAETLTYDNTPNAEVLTEEEQDSLAVGEELVEQQEQLLAGKYKNAEDLESAYLELQKKDQQIVQQELLDLIQILELLKFIGEMVLVGNQYRELIINI